LQDIEREQLYLNVGPESTMFLKTDRLPH